MKFALCPFPLPISFVLKCSPGTGLYTGEAFKQFAFAFRAFDFSILPFVCLFVSISLTAPLAKLRSRVGEPLLVYDHLLLCILSGGMYGMKFQNRSRQLQ